MPKYYDGMPERRYFDIIEVAKPERSQKGTLSLKCKTRRDYWITFWGDEHVSAVLEQEVPFRVSAYAKILSKEYFRTTGSTYWIDSNYPLKFYRIKNKKES